ncbi:hypothetical protein FRB93_011046 [Tulasnella sp. JGI-2019a]|nr:hypothetical protein FRB93_011046 [Tulasnella sp. JGI-2019a]
MLTHHGYSMSIHIDGEDLPNYQLEVDRMTHTVKCWVPSEAGKEFSIWVKKENQDRISAVVKVFFDGSEDHQMMDTLTYQDREYEMNEMLVGSSDYKALTFAKIQTTDDDDYVTQSSLQDIGTIHATFQQIQDIKVSKPHKNNCDESTGDSGNVTVHESNKKAGCHIVESCAKKQFFIWKPSI